MSKTQICFAGNGAGAVAALNGLHRNYSGIEIITDDDAVRDVLKIEDTLIPNFAAAKAELVVCAGYRPIISRELLVLKRYVNVHYSLLPKYRGLHSTVWAILNGEIEHGLSVHLMSEWIDDGPILAQFRFGVANMTSGEAMNRCHDIVECNLADVITNYLNGSISPQPQDKALATWVPRRNLADCLIDFHSSCDEISLFFKALVRPYPLPMINVRGVLYEVVEARLERRDYKCSVGRVVNVDEDGVWLKVADGLLVVQRLESSGDPVDPKSLLKLGQRL